MLKTSFYALSFQSSHTIVQTNAIPYQLYSESLFNQLTPPPSSIQDEIFDMVKPRDPYKITLQDLVSSSQGDTVTSILIDLNGFWTYENREVLVVNDSDSNNSDMDET